jgi:hypothetical protein
VLLAFEDAVAVLDDEDEPGDEFHFPLSFTWTLPPLPAGPDLLLLATELAGVGGPDLPLEVSAIDSFAAVTDARSAASASSPASRSRSPRSSKARSCCATRSSAASRQPLPARRAPLLAG